MAMLKGAMKWAGVLVIGFGLVWLLNWNEFDSPWGRATQAAKMELLKARLCN